MTMFSERGAEKRKMEAFLEEARSSGKWFAIADAQSFMQFHLDEEEEREVRRAKQALSRIRKAARNPRMFKDGQFDISRAQHALKESVRDFCVARSHDDEDKVDALQESISGLAAMFQLPGERGGVGGVLSALEFGPKKIADVYLEKMEQVELDDLHANALAYLKEHNALPKQ